MGAINMIGVLSAFSGRRVFITGHTGFKGSWLTFLLRELGAKVMGFALEPVYSKSHFEQLNLQNNIQHIVGDIREESLLSYEIQRFQPEYVFHLAAQALVKESYENPYSTFETNIMGSINLLEAVRKCESVRSLIYITSDKCYENVEWIWGYRENDQLGGHDPYSASKAAAEIVFSAYMRSFFSQRENLGIASVRAGNVIGGGDWAKDRIIPDCMKAIISGKPIYLRNPNSTRPWQHVLEPLSGYLLLANRLFEKPRDFRGAWNFGPSTLAKRNVYEVANSIVQHMQKGCIEIVESNEHHEAKLLQLNCDKSNLLLNWFPRWDVDKTIYMTAKWYESVFSGVEVQDVTRSQIMDYFWELR